MSIPPISAASLLVPAGTPRAPADLARVRQPILRGIPSELQLDADVTLVLVAPTGLAHAWRDVDPSSIVAASDDGVAPVAPAPDATDVAENVVARAPLRLLVRASGRTVGAVPLVVGARRLVPDSGAEGAGTRVDLAIVGYVIAAGNMRGAGDFGSYVEIAWRRVDRGADDFSPPRIDPRVAERLPAKNRLSSTLDDEIALAMRPGWRPL